MATVTVSQTKSNVNVSATTSNISVTEAVSNVVVSTGLTTAEVRSAISVANSTGDGSLSYNSATGGFTYTGPTASEVRAHLSGASPVVYNPSSGQISIDSSALFTGKTTDDLTEGSTNLYFTNARANSAIGAYQGTINTAGTITSPVGNLTTINATNLNTTNFNTGQLTTANIIVRDNRTGNSPEIIFIGEDSGNNANAAVGNLFLSTSSVLTSNTNIGVNASGLSFFGNVRPLGSDILSIGRSGVAEILLDKSDGIEILADNDLIMKGGVQGSGTESQIKIADGGNIEMFAAQTGDYVLHTNPGGVGNHEVVFIDGNSQGNAIILNRGHFSGLESGLHLMSSPAGQPSAGTDNDPVFIHTLLDVDSHIMPRNHAGSSAGFQRLGNADNAFSKSAITNNFSGRLFIPDSSSLSSQGDTLPGQGSNAAVIYHTGVNTGSTPLFRAAMTTNDWATASQGYPTVVDDGGVLLNNKHDFTGSHQISGIFDSTANIVTSANVVTNNIKPKTGVTVTVGGNLTVSGNINATGNINYENVVDLNVQDQEITLNSNAATDATVSIIANRPTGNNAVLRWNESSDKWEFNNTGSYFPLATSTDDLAEGSNQYFTNARARLAISATSPLSYNNSTGVISLTEVGDISEVIAGSGLTGGGNTGAVTLNAVGSYGITVNADNIEVNNSQIQAQANVAIGNNSTSNLSEGTNLYFTTARANSAIGAYQGSISTAGTITATKFDTTSNVFDLANAVTNLNSITSESANDKFTFKALLGGAATVTDTGNITSDGYEVLLDSSHTYDSTGNIAQKSSGTNNLNGFAVSGSFTSGSTVFSITGVTELKNVAPGGNIDGTNNNVSLTGDMVANMIPDNLKTLGGDQYPLPQGTLLSSANATALVFSQAAVANQTFANTAPIAIVHGGRDTSTGQIVGFLSQDDAVADGTQVVNIDSGGNGGIIALSFTGESPSTGETSDSITIGLPTTPSIPVGTAVTFAGVTGTGASNLNGQTLFIKRDVFGDNFNYTLTTDSGGTTAATMTAFGLASFNTGGGNITYSVPQSTSTINKARFYVKDAYGYPKVGPKAEDFTYTKGSATNYTIDLSAATKQTRGKTSLEAPKMALKAPEGLVIGENTTMSNRGDNDTFTNFGLNFVWDGLENYTNEYIGSSNTSLVPQMLFKNYTDNTFASSTSGAGRGGPRLFFSSNKGNTNTSEFDKYPRKSQEIGRMMFWGPTQSIGDSMSTVNPSGFISATAHEDWTSSNKLDMHFAANSNGFNNADVFLDYHNGQVVLASANNGTAQQPIHFAPATATSNGNAAQHYATLGHTWANVNYANIAGTSGSKFTVTQGTTDANGSGDLIIALDREFIAGTATQNLESQAGGGFTTLSDQGITPSGNETSATIVITNSGGGTPLGALSVGTAITFTGVLGAGNAAVNGVTFYIGRQHFGAGMYSLFKSSDGTTTPATTSDIAIVQPAAFNSTGTGGGSYSYTITGTAAKDYSLALESGSDQLKIKSGSTAKITIDDNFTEFGDRIRLKNLTTTQVNALASPAAGDMVFNTTLNQVCVYNGSGWRKLTDAAM